MIVIHNVTLVSSLLVAKKKEEEKKIHSLGTPEFLGDLLNLYIWNMILVAMHSENNEREKKRLEVEYIDSVGFMWSLILGLATLLLLNT